MIRIYDRQMHFDILRGIYGMDKLNGRQWSGIWNIRMIFFYFNDVPFFLEASDNL